MDLNFQFASLMDFLAMNGHGGFVWASYLITFLALVLLVVLPMVRKKSMLQQMKRQQKIEETRAG